MLGGRVAVCVVGAGGGAVWGGAGVGCPGSGPALRTPPPLRTEYRPPNMAPRALANRREQAPLALANARHDSDADPRPGRRDPSHVRAQPTRSESQFESKPHRPHTIESLCLSLSVSLSLSRSLAPSLFLSLSLPFLYLSLAHSLWRSLKNISLQSLLSIHPRLGRRVLHGRRDPSPSIINSLTLTLSNKQTNKQNFLITQNCNKWSS